MYAYCYFTGNVPSLKDVCTNNKRFLETYTDATPSEEAVRDRIIDVFKLINPDDHTKPAKVTIIKT
jgi:hypothetical protein